jgi:glycine cleavage system aminomethyltransferase T
VASELAWLRTHVGDGSAAVVIRDVSDELATIGLWGPLAREILGGASRDAFDDAALPARTAREIRVGGAPVLASRISYAGEDGWELTAEARWAVEVWDRLRAAGDPVGLEPFGYRALDSLRMEKGYRYFGTDLTMLETPFEAGLGAFVRLRKDRFIGREALVEARDAEPDGPGRRLRTVVIGVDAGAAYLPVYGGEAVRADGEVISRLRSVAYGPTVSRTIGYAYLPSSLAEGHRLEVDVFDQRLAAVIAADVLVDPGGDRLRG